jgi:hypothetical protein
MIADHDEATDLVPFDAEPFWHVPASGANEQVAWRFENLVVVVSGSGGPAITAVAARFLAHPPDGIPFDQVINFGSCGSYSWADGVKLASAYFVSESRQWDLFFNFRGWEYANGAMTLWTPSHDCADEDLTVTCFSGGRYSTPGDRHWPMWLSGDVEEYELYSLAWLCMELDVPLAGLKFVTNSPDADATTQKGANLAAARLAGTMVLRSLLCGDLGPIDVPPSNQAAAASGG